MQAGQAGQPQSDGRPGHPTALAALRRQRLAGRLEQLIHDLRNPLSVIQGYGQLLRASAQGEGDQRDLEALLAEVERLGGRLDELDALLLPAPARAEPVDLDQLVRLAARCRAPVALPTPTWEGPAPLALGHLASYAQALAAGWERLPTPRHGQQLGLVGAPAGRLVLTLAEGALPGRMPNEWPGVPSPTEELRLCADQLAGYGARLVVDGRVLWLDMPSA